MDVLKLFGRIAEAVDTVLSVNEKAIVCIRDDLLLASLAALAALFGRVAAGLSDLAQLFIESAESEAGKMPRSTINLKHFALCAIVTRHPPPRIGLVCLSVVSCACVTRVSHLDCTVRCHMQDASEDVTRLYACVSRPCRRFGFHRAPGMRRGHRRMAVQMDCVALRVQVYFSALLIEHGLSVTGLSVTDLCLRCD